MKTLSEFINEHTAEVEEQVAAQTEEVQKTEEVHESEDNNSEE